MRSSLKNFFGFFFVDVSRARGALLRVGFEEVEYIIVGKVLLF